MTVSLPHQAINDGSLQRWSLMVEMRAFEEACHQGFLSREIHGELHLGIGQEAVAAGLHGHLRPEDALVSTHRNHLHALAKGVDPFALLAEIFEREAGLCGGRGGHMHPFDPAHNFSATGIVGASLPVALGYAYAFAMEKRPLIAVAILGDGATNTGAFHECMNMAAAWCLPLLVIVENNGYAISVKATEVTAAPGIAARAAAYGIAGCTVDGTDVEAVHAVIGDAVGGIRAGGGPVLVEAFCERFRGHYEGDADTYRSRAERQALKKQDPVALRRQQLVDAGYSQVQLDALSEGAREAISAILMNVRASPMPQAALARSGVFLSGDRA